MSPVVVLVGPPGAGKSTVGRLLADRLGVAFRDTDDDVEQIAGMPVSDIFVDLGEARFRELERAAVRAALQSDGVLAVGGGAVADPGTRGLLAGHRVAFLELDLHDAAKRVGLSRERPVNLPSPRSALKRLLDAQRPLYQEVAGVTIATGERTPEQVAAEVLAALSEWPVP